VSGGVLAIDPSAKIAPTAVIGAGVEIGPYCVIGPNVTIGDGCKLVAQAHVTGHTTIGAGTAIYPFASLGTPPQSVHYRGGPTKLTIGARCQIREGVTVNIGTEDGGGITTVGDDCFLMAGSHVAHDCHVGNHVVFANNAVIGGHVEIGDYVFLGGQAAVLQRVRVGESVMIAGYTALREDAVPFGYVLHPIGRLVGLNVVGMRRRGFSRDTVRAIRAAYQTLFENGDGVKFSDRLDQVDAAHGAVAEVGRMIAFLRAAKKPVMMTRPRGSNADTGE
jgi:UDP-N-acetylglucosamine acyltransferase